MFVGVAVAICAKTNDELCTNMIASTKNKNEIERLKNISLPHDYFPAHHVHSTRKSDLTGFPWRKANDKSTPLNFL